MAFSPSPPRTFENAYDVRRGGTSSPAGAPIRGYDDLTAEQLVDRIEAMTAPDVVRDVLAYEQRTKGRKTVTSTAQGRLTDLLAPETASADSGG